MKERIAVPLHYSFRPELYLNMLRSPICEMSKVHYSGYGLLTSQRVFDIVREIFAENNTQNSIISALGDRLDQGTVAGVLSLLREHKLVEGKYKDRVKRYQLELKGFKKEFAKWAPQLKERAKTVVDKKSVNWKKIVFSLSAPKVNRTLDSEQGNFLFGRFWKHALETDTVNTLEQAFDQIAFGFAYCFQGDSKKKRKKKLNKDLGSFVTSLYFLKLAPLDTLKDEANKALKDLVG